jgi:tRNA (adenine22-N1)-methyltransferase
VNEGPLQRGRETAESYAVADKITFCRRDGLAGLDRSQADTVVIAGMGGELIARILSQAPWTREVTLLLQPMSSQPELRAWLLANGYRIPRETIVREGEKFYTVLRAEGGQEPRPYTQAERFAGRQRQGEENPHRGAYLEDLLARRRKALQGKQAGHTADAQEEAALVAELEAMQKEWMTWQR